MSQAKGLAYLASEIFGTVLRGVIQAVGREFSAESRAWANMSQEMGSKKKKLVQ